MEILRALRNFFVEKLYFVNVLDFIWTWSSNFYKVLDFGWTWTEVLKFRIGSGS